MPAEKNPSPRRRPGGPSRRGNPRPPSLPPQRRGSKNMMMMLLLFCVGLLFVQLYSADRESDLVDRTTFLGWMADSTVGITEL